MRILYFENHVLTLSYDRERKTGYAVWNGFLSSSEFQEATTKCVELMEKEELVNWLADNRKMKAIRQADQQWFLENIVPRLLHSSLQRMATLVSHDIFNKMAVDNIMQRAGTHDHLTMRDFQDEAAATAWLEAPASTAAQESFNA
ncbi:STAS/SEC14 domain-containing protein [Rufibacter roseus]|uniref:STAS/SEC14 domain-containing protein n=1 Tax=Rufibacter roseus TaxID=1567108 RepID=A0ABW2DIF1_9BACT|nr:STAS/SEC14 domain-containing protein [Rufibacter roseus]